MRFIQQILRACSLPATPLTTSEAPRRAEQTWALPTWSSLCSSIRGNFIFVTVDVALHADLSNCPYLSEPLIPLLEKHTYLLVPLGGLNEVESVKSSAECLAHSKCSVNSGCHCYCWCCYYHHYPVPGRKTLFSLSVHS